MISVATSQEQSASGGFLLSKSNAWLVLNTIGFLIGIRGFYARWRWTTDADNTNVIESIKAGNIEHVFYFSARSTAQAVGLVVWNAQFLLHKS